ncbi:polyketide cyclase [Knoellia sinensis KCTC 19936]|uniref:Polyketide cyclase n=1 Tax=Knoellia sinensis KCTC 19936 TaxID=1385520 RepID=A0A0A0J1P2_9MICO|nr:SRPBCC family protein [Knoellia sinensis]KGN31340.1 polyketide cyclase [Knoellia sinensis KCTC 19936]
MRIIRTITVDVPRSAAFEFLSDFTTTMEWDPATVLTERVSGDRGVGTVYRNVSRFLGRESELTYEVTTLEPGRRFALRGENKTLVAHDVMTFAGDERRTELTYEATFTFKGLARVVAPLLAPAFTKLGDDAEQGLHSALQRLAGTGRGKTGA